MTIEVRYFASIREALGPRETLDWDGDATVGQARDRLIARSPAHAAALARSRTVRCAVDQTLCDDSAVLHVLGLVQTLLDPSAAAIASSPRNRRCRNKRYCSALPAKPPAS